MKVNLKISPATWVTIGVAIVITAYLYWFYTHFDKVIEEVDIGPISEVNANPFYAAEKFLETLGKKAESQKNYSILDEELHPYDTLIIESTRVGLSVNKRERIRDWITGGGHLILLATEVYDDELGTSRDLLLDELGVRLYENSSYSWDLDQEEEITKLTFDGTDIETEIDFHYDYYLQDSNDESVFLGGNEYSDLFVQYDFGQGMISIVTDMDIWKNYQINEHDHAMFLYQLVGGADNVWFLYNTIQPSLLSVMIDLIPMVIISFLLILTAAIFSASWRRGSPREDDLKVQREIMQHIEAAGEFSYRNDFGKVLISDLLSSLEIRLKKSIHLYGRLTENKKIEKISHLTGKSKTQLAGLFDVEQHNQEDFINKVLLIQEIKKLL